MMNHQTATRLCKELLFKCEKLGIRITPRGENWNNECLLKFAFKLWLLEFFINKSVVGKIETNLKMAVMQTAMQTRPTNQFVPVVCGESLQDTANRVRIDVVIDWCLNLPPEGSLSVDWPFGLMSYYKQSGAVCSSFLWAATMEGWEFWGNTRKTLYSEMACLRRSTAAHTLYNTLINVTRNFQLIVNHYDPTANKMV